MLERIVPAALLLAATALPANAQFFSCDKITGVSVAYTPGGPKSFCLKIVHGSFDLIAFPCASSGFIITSSPSGTFSWGTAGGWNGCVGVLANTTPFDFDVNPQLPVFYLRHAFSGSPNKFGCQLTYGPFLNPNASFKPYGELDDTGATANVMTLVGSGGSGLPSTIDAAGAPSGAIGLFAVSTAAGATPLLGGTLYVDLGTAVLVPSLADGAGQASLAYTAGPALAGVSIFAQAAFDDPLQSAGFALSHGLEIVL
ncbi:hypothetical protein [Engelhardtia mirabilis]|uniref:Uncharacterized protein n=1 Tax=Engelhardtia mirabilis TaxID=2528011 RepID=A0A518BE94_9BACT|nr:hypothetical protein Pla133_03740 [Planctomycetes bacterium Pla133]QDU99635.1 hypothetical protein Pla86_03740 [Planctomycetes bacterium Pla86]